LTLLAGGKSSFSLADGSQPEAPKVNKYQAMRNASSISFGTDTAPETFKSTHTAKANESHFKLAYSPEQRPTTAVNECQASRQKSSIFDTRSPLKSSNATAAPTYKYGVKLQTAQSSPKDTSVRPSTRVMAPPGGRSSNIFG
jgi:hypothetical protein